MQNNREQIIQNVKEKKLIAIVRGIDPVYMTDLGNALLAGGINMVEVTFDQRQSDDFSATVSAVSALKEALGEKMYVGAGTVLTREQVDLAVSAGAGYIVTPAVDCSLIRYAREKGLVLMPGAMTPTEAYDAYNAGADFVKVFPAGVLGPSYIKAIRGPLPHIPLLAVGGISEKNIPDFLATGVMGFGIGGNLVNGGWIREGRFDRISQLASVFVQSTKTV